MVRTDHAAMPAVFPPPPRRPHIRGATEARRRGGGAAGEPGAHRQTACGCGATVRVRDFTPVEIETLLQLNLWDLGLVWF